MSCTGMALNCLEILFGLFPSEFPQMAQPYPTISVCLVYLLPSSQGSTEKEAFWKTTRAGRPLSLKAWPRPGEICPPQTTMGAPCSHSPSSPEHKLIGSIGNDTRGRELWGFPQTQGRLLILAFKVQALRRRIALQMNLDSSKAKQLTSPAVTENFSSSEIFTLNLTLLAYKLILVLSAAPKPVIPPQGCQS